MTAGYLKIQLCEKVVELLREFHAERAMENVSTIYELKVEYNATKDEVLKVELETSNCMTVK